MTLIGIAILMALAPGLLLGSPAHRQRPPRVSPTPTQYVSYLPVANWERQFGLDNGLYLGVFFNPEMDMIGALQDFETLVGKRHPIYHYYTYWGFGGFSEHRFLLDQIVAYGATPMITFMSVPGPGQTGCSDAQWNLDAINDGRHDTYLTQFAAEIKAYPARFLFRWGHEMNLNQYSWSGYCNGANTAAAEKYIQAYRRIVDIFRSEGATNVQWIWSPSYLSFPPETWNDPNAYYPGTDYVDWIGVVAYNWGQSRSDSGYEWDTFDALLQEFLSHMTARHPTRPIMLADYASVEDDGGDKAAWITDAFAKMKQYPHLKAAVWFHYNPPEYPPPLVAFRIDSSADALQAYRQAIQDPYFLTAPP